MKFTFQSRIDHHLTKANYKYLSMYARLFILFLMLLIISGCKEEESSPKPCGRVDITINGVLSGGTKPFAVISEMKTQLNMSLFTVVNMEDTLRLNMAVLNWAFANPSPTKALVNTFRHEVTYSDCKSAAENLGNCASYFGSAVYKTKDLFYYVLDHKPDESNRIRIMSVNESKKTLSGDFNLRAVRIDDSGLGDTITLSGSFTDVCYLIKKIE